AAFFADTAWKRARRMRSRTGMGLSWLRSVLPIWFIARSKCWPPGQHTWEPTSYSTRPTWTAGRRRRWCRGARLPEEFESESHAGRRFQGPAFVHRDGRSLIVVGRQPTTTAADERPTTDDE